MNTHFSSFVMYNLFELEHAKTYQFFDQRISTNHHGLVDVVWKRDRCARATGKRWFKSRRLTDQKRKKETGGTVWSVNEKGKKRKRQVGKE